MKRPMTTPQPNPTDDLEAARKAVKFVLRGYRPGGASLNETADAILDLRPAGVGEAVGYVQRSVAQGHYDDHATIFNDCSESHDCPLYAHPAHPDAALMERVRTVLEPFAEVLADVGDEEHDLDTYKAMSYQHRRATAINIGHLRAAAALLSDLKAEAGR